MSEKYTSTDNTWVGIYKGILGFLTNKEDLDDKNLDAPGDWPDLLDSSYKGLIWSSNYNTAGTAKLILNTCVQKYGHDGGIQYLVDLDKNIAQYTKAGGGPSKSLGTGECTIGIGMVFQSYALLPHYNIFDNVAYGLKLRKLPKEEIRERVTKILGLVGLDGMPPYITPPEDAQSLCAAVEGALREGAHLT